MSIPLPEFFTPPGVRDIDSQEDRMAARNPQYEADLRRIREAYGAEMARRRATGGAPPPQPAQPAPQAQQAQQQPPPEFRPEVHMHVAAPRVDTRGDLERMGDNVEEAMRDENDSRVSQMREAKRMQHAKELEAMRQEGLLQRLQAMNDSSYEQPAPAPGGPVGVFDPEAGQFRYYNGVRFG